MDAPDDIKDILGENEKVELYIKERIYHPQISIDSLIVTNERVILRHPHALGMKKDYTDYSYSDITGAALDKGLMRSTINLTIKGRVGTLELERLPPHLAEQAYGIIREYIGRFQAPFAIENASAEVAVPVELAVQEDLPSPPAEQITEEASQESESESESGTLPKAVPKYCPYCSAPLTGSPYCGTCGNKVE